MKTLIELLVDTIERAGESGSPVVPRTADEMVRMANLALRCWRTFSRRSPDKSPAPDLQIADLAKGLRDYYEERRNLVGPLMEDYRHLATVLAPQLRSSSTNEPTQLEASIARRPLNELDKIGWSSLRTAHGTADQVPVALVQFAGATEPGTTLFDSTWQLDNVVVLQGTVYESAYETVPFILDILLSTTNANIRDAAYDLLIEIAAGVSDPAHPHVVIESGKTVDLVDGCKKRIRTARPHYSADLLASDSEHGLKLRSLDLLFAIRDDSMQLATLLRRIEPGDDDEFRAQLASALIELDFP